MKNSYEVRGDVTAIFLNSPKYGQMETLIDTADLPRVQEFQNTWYLQWDRGSKGFYAQGSLPNENGKWTTVKLHRWITNSNDGQIVDHISHETLDNRKSMNLRVCTKGENTRNQRPRKGCSSIFKGVHMQSRKRKWVARIKVKEKSIYLGVFDTEIDAALAYNEAAKMHHGEFSMLNNIQEVTNEHM
jgi:hypothetical protein